MADLTYFMLGFALDPIEAAYKAGSEYLRKQFTEAERDYDNLLRSAEAEGRDLYEIDEETGQGFDVGEHTYYRQVVIENALQAHRQAFATMIHHAWEKHVCFVLRVPEYRFKNAYAEMARKIGATVDRGRLERLRKTANCVKHESAELYDAHPEMFDGQELHLMDASLTPSERKADKRVSKTGERGDWLDALRLSDADIADFIDAVRTSALPSDKFRKKWRHPASEGDPAPAGLSATE